MHHPVTLQRLIMGRIESLTGNRGMSEALESVDEPMSGSFDNTSSNSFVLSQEDTFSTPGPERDAFARSTQRLLDVD